MLKIYNTLTSKKEEFVPLNPPAVHFYMCGPTVYDLFHIGNGRSFIMADVIRRYLDYRGYAVKFVMNLTDIDDKIIRKSHQENMSAAEVATAYSQAFFDDIGKLGIKPATVYPRATEHIEDIIGLISRLIENGVAYESQGDVYYNISKFSGYGKLSGKNIEELAAGARVEVSEIKQSPLDFALWKKAKEGEPFWESPWGKGRPGWHIECSAMSCKHLGESFDIHAGGSDLIFPHHENEIAQSEGATGKQFVKYWIHFGFLNIDNEKMSKSLGNFFTVRDILKKYPAEALRFFFAQTHYAAPLNFTEEAIDAAQRGLEKISNVVHRLKSEIEKADEAGAGFSVQEFYDGFNAAMDDDFNSPKALAVIFDFIKEVNKALASGKMSKSALTDAFAFMEKTASGVLGLVSDTAPKQAGLEHQLMNLLLDLRVSLKKEKNYKLADEIRDKLKVMGVILEDTKEGTTYKLQ